MALDLYENDVSRIFVGKYNEGDEYWHFSKEDVLERNHLGLQSSLSCSHCRDLINKDDMRVCFQSLDSQQQVSKSKYLFVSESHFCLSCFSTFLDDLHKHRTNKSPSIESYLGNNDNPRLYYSLSSSTIKCVWCGEATDSCNFGKYRLGHGNVIVHYSCLPEMYKKLTDKFCNHLSKDKILSNIY